MTQVPRPAGKPRSARLRVALTHSPGRLEGLEELLEAKGFEVLRRPLIETVPRTDEETRAKAEVLASLPWLLFTSRSAVEALAALGFDLGAETPLLGAIGPGTASALERLGGRPELVAGRHDGFGLVDSFARHAAASGPVGLPRGNRARLEVERLLRERGFEPRPVTVYDTVIHDWDMRQESGVDAVVVASPSAVSALPDSLGRNSRLVALGGATARAVTGRGWSCEATKGATPDEVLRAVERGVR